MMSPCHSKAHRRRPSHRRQNGPTRQDVPWKCSKGLCQLAVTSSPPAASVQRREGSEHRPAQPVTPPDLLHARRQRPVERTRTTEQPRALPRQLPIPNAHRLPARRTHPRPLRRPPHTPAVRRPPAVRTLQHRSPRRHPIPTHATPHFLRHPQAPPTATYPPAPRRRKAFRCTTSPEPRPERPPSPAPIPWLPITLTAAAIATVIAAIVVHKRRR